MNTSSRRQWFKQLVVSVLATPVILREVCKPIAKVEWSKEDVELYHRLPFYLASLQIKALDSALWTPIYEKYCK